MSEWLTNKPSAEVISRLHLQLNFFLVLVKAFLVRKSDDKVRFFFLFEKFIGRY